MFCLHSLRVCHFPEDNSTVDGCFVRPSGRLYGIDRGSERNNFTNKSSDNLGLELDESVALCDSQHLTKNQIYHERSVKYKFSSS
jgi:hypothetical protein